jgi:hypothetical protein
MAVDLDRARVRRAAPCHATDSRSGWDAVLKTDVAVLTTNVAVLTNRVTRVEEHLNGALVRRRGPAKSK